MSENGGEIGAFMAGFVIGGLVGAATALIMAPQSGAETRAKIAAKGGEWRRTGEQQFQEFSTYAGSAMNDARGRVSDTSGQVQEKARIVLDEGRSRVTGDREEDQESDQAEVDETVVQDISSEDDEGDAAD
jgi:gas vesicle protein